MILRFITDLYSYAHPEMGQLKVRLEFHEKIAHLNSSSNWLDPTENVCCPKWTSPSLVWWSALLTATGVSFWNHLFFSTPRHVRKSAMTLFVRAIFSNVWDLTTKASVGIELGSSFVFGHQDIQWTCPSVKMRGYGGTGFTSSISKLPSWWENEEKNHWILSKWTSICLSLKKKSETLHSLLPPTPVQHLSQVTSIQLWDLCLPQLGSHWQIDLLPRG